jgi:hypothetical protein
MSGGSDRNATEHDDAYRAPALDRELPEAAGNLRRRGKMWVALMIGAHTVFWGVGFFNFFVAWRQAEESFSSGAAVFASFAFPFLAYAAELALLVALYRGKAWARMVLLLWVGFGFLAAGWIVGSHPIDYLRNSNLWGVARLAEAAWMFGMLLVSPSIRALVRTRAMQPLEDEDDDDDDDNDSEDDAKAD